MFIWLAVGFIFIALVFTHFERLLTKILLRLEEMENELKSEIKENAPQKDWLEETLDTKI